MTNSTDYKQRRQLAPKNVWKALAILILGIFITSILTFFSYKDVEFRSKTEYGLICNEIKSKISLRLMAHAQLLRSGASLFAASDTVTRNEWRVFFEHNNLKVNLPGIQGFGYSQIIPKDQLSKHIQAIQNEGFSDYRIKPEGTREIYTSIIFLEPFAGRNLRAFGYDMFSEPTRRQAMELSRDSDVAMLTGRVTLVQETNQNVQIGTLMYVPVYKNGMPVQTAQERRAAIKGWVYSPYRMNDLMNGILGHWDTLDDNRIHLQIFDNNNRTTSSLLYDSQSDDTLNLNDLALRTLSIPINFNGNIWTLYFTQANEQLSIYESKVAIVFLGGLIISFLMSGLFLSLINIKSKAESIADKLTAELRESEEKYSIIFNNDIYAICIFDLKSLELLDVNDAYTRVYGFTREELISGMTIHDITAEHQASDVATVKATKEGTTFIPLRYHKKKDGTIFPVEIVGGPYEWQGRKVMFALAHDITKRKEAQEGLQDAIEKLDSAMVNGGLAWWEIELPSGKCVFSRYIAEMLGYSPKKFNHYEDFTSIVHPDDYEGTMQSMRDHLSGKNERYEIDYRILNSSGKYVWMRDIGKLSNKQTDPDKKIITGIVIDINESKKAELALQESETKFRKMADDAPILIWESGTDKLCYNFNKVWLEFTGRTLEQEMGNGWAEGVHPEDLENCLEIYTNAFDNRESFSMEYRLKHHSGEYRWVMDNGTPRFTDDGVFWGYIGSCYDITEIKRKERIILSFAEKYKTLLETCRDGMHLLDTKGNLIECNESFCQMLGYTKEEMLTFNVVDWDAQIPIDDIINIVNDIIDKPALFETKHRTKTGEILIVEINAAGVEIDDRKYLYASARDITDRKKAEEELALERQRLADILKGTNAGTWEWNVQTGETIYNERWAEIIGYRLEEISPVSIETWMKYAHPDDLKVSGELLEKHFKGELDYYEFESRMKHKDGSLVWVLDRGRVHEWDADGKPLLMSGTHQDITDRKKAEDTLRFANEYNRSLIEASLDPLVIIGPDGKITDVNSATEEVTGYFRDILIGTDFSDYFTDPESARRGLKEAFQEGAVYDYPLEIRNRDGQNISVLYNATVFWDSTGKLVGVFAAARDITESKKAEEELALERQRLAAILQGTNAGTWEWNVQTGETLYNKRWAEIIGYTLEEISPVSIETWMKYAHPDDLIVSDELLEKHFKGELDYYEFESRMKHKDGSLVWVLDRGRVHEWDADGKPLLMSGTHQDITEKKRTDTEIKLKNELLVKTNGERDKFFSIIAHDLKSPFSGFLGLTKIMSEEMQSLTMAEMQSFSKSMQKSAENLYNLLENLLEWSRMQRGLIVFKPMTYDVSLLIDQNITIQMEVAKLKNITLMSSITERILVQTDEPMFNGIMRNLISNAIKFTPRGGRIEIGDSSDGLHLKGGDHLGTCIYIKDNGIGMDEDTVGKLFKLDEKISRPGTEHEPSTGLGLLLCKEFIEKQGGRIWVESEEGKGSTFYFTLPKDVQPLRG